MKVTVIGAGAVGATSADNIARKEIASEVVVLDIKEGFAEGKAIDMMQTLVENLGLLIRNAGFAWEMLDEQLSEASHAFWQPVDAAA